MSNDLILSTLTDPPIPTVKARSRQSLPEKSGKSRSKNFPGWSRCSWLSEGEKKYKANLTIIYKLRQYEVCMIHMSLDTNVHGHAHGHAHDRDGGYEYQYGCQ